MKFNNVTTKIPVKINTETAVIPMNIHNVAPSVEVYKGVYEVTPLPYAEIELPTAKKLLEQDVIVGTIPYYETQNESGTTIIIGE